ncbi:phage terminase large subunit [Nocardioides lijunqiniae]|uniref:phage terminase large subunit n=1 Tax=Nocardioides lijunqiniae TaxID=2760832 RepID=UPI0018785A5B|nr:phage terminase large subunit [Nocardioides lijunqiniae]
MVASPRSWVDDLERELTGIVTADPAAEEGRWATPGTLAAELNPKTVQTPALDKIDAALAELLDTPDGRLIITIGPQEGKSTRVAKDFPTWVLKHRPWTRIVTGSYGQTLANRNGLAIRRTITSNPQLGMRIAADNGSASDWQLAGQEGGVVSVGIGAGLTGRPADLMVIDDPIKDRKEADSEKFRQNVWDWWTDVASTRLAPGAPVVLILTRWHEDDLAGRLLAAEDGHLWKVLNIPAQADHDPDKGETDPLGRKPGEFLESARRRTREQWEAIKTRVGSRTWNSLYQGRPSAVEGNIVLRDWWKYYPRPLWIVRDDGVRVITEYDEMLASWDMTFKDKETSDYVVGQVWMRRGARAYLLDQVRGRWAFAQTRREVKAFAARWPQAVMKLIEDKANGSAIISSLGQTVPGIIPEEPSGSKSARLEAVSPFIEAGNVWLPDPTIEGCAWVGDLVEEYAGFPHATHDDMVDTGSQALNRLLLQPLLAGGGEVFDEEDFDDELADYTIAPYAS